MSRSAQFFAFLLVVGVLLQGVARALPPEDQPAPADPVATEVPAATATEASPAALEAPPVDAEPEAAASSRPPLPTLDASATVVVIPIHGTIDLGLPPFLDRVLAEHADASLLILDVDTFGGRVDGAVRLRDALLTTEVPTLAFVNRRAISAGALISLAADHIVFTPGGSLGAATPVEIGEGGEMEAVGEKMVSYMRAEMRATAEATGRDGDLAEAMVDRTVVIEGVVDETKLLTVSTELARTLHLADGVADDLDALLASMGATEATVVHAQANWAEVLTRWLTDPTVSGLLISLGMLGLMVELYSPGVGFPGLVGVVCLAAFFGGHAVADLAGTEEILLLILGVVALAVEAFVVPGFGLPGVIGLFLIAAALALSMVGLPLDVSWNLGLFTDALTRVVWSLLATLVALIAIVSFLPGGNVLPSFLVLRTKLGGDGPEPEASEADFRSAPDQSSLVGKHGVAETDLRPSGKVRIDGHIVDVVSDHAWIARGTPVVVTEVEGVRVVVDTPVAGQPPTA